MQRITALTLDASPAASRPMLEAVQKKLGMIPNLFKTFSHSPAVLGYYLAGSEALGGGTLSAALREQIALTRSLHGFHHQLQITPGLIDAQLAS